MPVFKARYNGPCAKCGAAVEPGQYVSWSRRQRGTIYHAACIGAAIPDDGQPGEQPQPQPAGADAPEPAAVPGIGEDRVRAIAQEEDARNLGALLNAVEER